MNMNKKTINVVTLQVEESCQWLLARVSWVASFLPHVYSRILLIYFVTILLLSPVANKAVCAVIIAYFQSRWTISFAGEVRVQSINYIYTEWPKIKPMPRIVIKSH